MARFPDLCRAIKAKRAAIQQARRTGIASALKTALSEDPPPTLEEVARRVGYASNMCLRAWEPRLCTRLVERRHRFAEQSKKVLKNRLKAALRDTPPPSLAAVHARLGITTAISYGNFPEIHRAIAARHHRFQRRAKTKSAVSRC